jgi:hypothetical protein
MDAKQFDELVARLAEGPSRRDALKGMIGGALASVGIGAAADDDAEAKKGKGKGGGGKGKGNGRGGKGKGNGRGGKGKGGGGGDDDDDDGGADAGDEKKKRKRKKKKKPICHCPDGNPENCVTLRLKKKARKKHLRNHPLDHKGACTGDECNSDADCAPTEVCVNERCVTS